jgi:hypothetical protein
MRLFELIQEDPFDVKDTIVKDVPLAPMMHRTRARFQPKTDILGHGYFSTTVGHQDSPHDAVKISNAENSRNDGYEEYLRLLSRNPELRDNIHVPRIRSARVITSSDKNKKRMLLVRMERLEPIKNLSEREAYELVKSLVGREEAIRQKNNPRMFTSGDPWVRALNGVLFRWERGELDSNQIIHDDIRDTVEFLRKFAGMRQIGFDLHDENWMIRRTPYGPQLVISDPFSFMKSK